MERDYLDFDIAIETTPTGQVARVTGSPAGTGSAPFVLPFGAVELAQFMNAVGPPRVASRRLVPVEARVGSVRDYGSKLGSALLTGEVGVLFRASLSSAKQQGRGLRVRLRLDGAPDLDPVPWEYVYDSALGRFLTLSSQTPVVRVLEALDVPAPVTVTAPLRVLVLVSDPSGVVPLAVQREAELLHATTADLVKSGRLELVVLEQSTLGGLQRALLETFHVFHFIGHGGFDEEAGEGVLVLEREDGTAHRVGASRLGTLLHDASAMQLVVLNACEGARAGGRDAFAGVAQALVRQGLPAVVAMQTEISDRAALVFCHEFYYYVTRGLPIDAAMCEVRKAMSTSDEASEWGTAVLVRSGSGQPFDLSALGNLAEPAPERRLESLYETAKASLAAGATEAALPLLEQISALSPDYADTTQLLERVHAGGGGDGDGSGGGGTGGGGSGGGSPGPTDTQPLPTPHPTPIPPGPTPGPTPGPLRRLWKWLAGGLAVLAAVVVALVVIGGDDTDPDPPPPTATPTVTGTAGTGGTTGSTGTATGSPVEVACGASASIPQVDSAISIPCTTRAPVMDGDFSEWEGVPAVAVDQPVFASSSGTNPQAASGSTQLLWDRTALYVSATVRDSDIRDVNESRPDQYWRGDGISFEFGPDARNLGEDAGLRNTRDRHVLIGLSAGRALGAMNIAVRGDFPSGGMVTAIDARLELTPDGYRIEASVPWQVLGELPPRRGTVFAGNLNISDAKPNRSRWELGTMVSSNPQRTATIQKHPALWQVLVLGEPG